MDDLHQGHYSPLTKQHIHYTDTELRKLHRHFLHPKPARLLSVLRQAGDIGTGANTLAGLSSSTSMTHATYVSALVLHRSDSGWPSLKTTPYNSTA